MSEKRKTSVTVDDHSVSSTLDDDKLLEDIGYVPSFKREFSNLATVCFSASPGAIDSVEQILLFADQLRVQYYGTVFECRDDLQHPATARWASVGDVVLDPGRVHVLYSW